MHQRMRCQNCSSTLDRQHQLETGPEDFGDGTSRGLVVSVVRPAFLFCWTTDRFHPDRARTTMTAMSEGSCKPGTKPDLVAVDLFCGAGGLTRGLEKAGIRVALGVDCDPACAFPFEYNNQAAFALKSVEDLRKGDLTDAFDNARFTVLAGCAPCQPFSKYRLGKGDESDHRWHLLKHFQRLATAVSPTLVTMENVPRLMEQKIFTDFVHALKRAGYFVSYESVRCADYGVPQQRERLVLLASKLGPIGMIRSTHAGRQRTVRQMIAKMPTLLAGNTDRSDPLHQAARLSPTNFRRIQASKPGGTWRDWKSNLVAECHRRQSGRTYPSVYGRMVWDEPAPTVTTQFFGFGNGRFGHPEQDRAISLREGAILQSFPKTYRFVEPGKPIHFKTVGRLIGNAVPVKLAEAIGRSIRKHVESFVRQESGQHAHRVVA